jgi:hypothetical protein
MMVKRFGIALALLISATSAGLAQSQSGSNFGVPYSGSAATRSGGGGHVYARHRDSGGGAQRPQSSGGERDARDSGSSGAVARQASTPYR